jgi:hypothetical protein
MFVRKSHCIRTHVVGGGGIFDTAANIVKRITGNTIGDLASKLVVSAGKSMASEAGKRLASRFIAAQPPSSALTPALQNVAIPLSALPPAQQQVNIPQPLTGFTSQNAINHQAKVKEIIGKYSGSGVTTTTPQHNAITIQDLVRKMHQGSGLKMIE